MNPKKEKQIQIDESLFKDLIWVFDSLDIYNYDEGFRNALESVTERLNAKKNSLEKRESYSKLIDANKSGDEDRQHEAKIEYLQKKRNLL